MSTGGVNRRRIALAGGSALMALSTLVTGCGTSGQGPSTTTTTTSSSPASAPTPTEKSVSPTGGNLFTPGVIAPGAPTVPPGQHPGLGGAH
ncbi:hypothetical protein ABIA30_002814 [Mycobacterium sp. MAA66]|uniref:hypothetical protein n=1 Tax=Mycobacterium sp. MAA66 TaxID=3156297 RepID=UPI0035155778